MTLKEKLIKAGYSEAQADSIVAMVGESYVATEQLTKAQADLAAKDLELRTARAEVTSLQTQVAEVEALKAEKTALETTHSQELAKMKLENQMKMALMTDKNGLPQDLDLVFGLLKRDTISLAEDGTLKGLDEQLTALRTSKPFLFTTPGATQPQGAGWKPTGKEPETKDVPSTDLTGADFGKSLATTKISMLGMTPANTEKGGSV